ncbi:hypothetical protein BDV98DRAFT_288831 [Pterulicium gracile]|uniref:Zn(2)-C6 fungal-type domain-containing protein n=1 Tax=Pterulicium gracile TaxID=1884261 RepID=A0A5C3QTA1_9AGAR|nr:hypothetical protein BDV98DRAFT_288831 [Pterula gracilis]
MGFHAKSPSSPTMRTRGAANVSTRAKLACQGCRRDNKKVRAISAVRTGLAVFACDDKRPCSRCVARNEECVHVERGPKLVKVRCGNCRTYNKRCQDSRPCDYCTENGMQCVDISRKDRGLGTRVKTACTHCRRDKIRCDGVRPCSHCARRYLECTDPPCKLCSKSDVECHHQNSPSSPLDSPPGSTFYGEDADYEDEREQDYSLYSPVSESSPPFAAYPGGASSSSCSSMHATSSTAGGPGYHHNAHMSTMSHAGYGHQNQNHQQNQIPMSSYPQHGYAHSQNAHGSHSAPGPLPTMHHLQQQQQMHPQPTGSTSYYGHGGSAGYYGGYSGQAQGQGQPTPPGYSSQQQHHQRHGSTSGHGQYGSQEMPYGSSSSNYYQQQQGPGYPGGPR